MTAPLMRNGCRADVALNGMGRILNLQNTEVRRSRGALKAGKQMPWSAPGLEWVLCCSRLRLLQLLFQSIDQIVQPACDQPRGALQDLEEIL